MSLDPYHTPYIKTNYKWNTDLNVGTQIIRVLEENTGNQLKTLDLGKNKLYKEKKNKTLKKKFITADCTVQRQSHQDISYTTCAS